MIMASKMASEKMEEILKVSSSRDRATRLVKVLIALEGKLEFLDTFR